MRIKHLVFLALSSLLGGTIFAQGEFRFTPQSEEGNVQCVKISLKSLIRSCPTLSYEHTMTSGNGSVEGSFGWFTQGNTNNPSGVLLKAGYKWTFPIGYKNKELSQNGYLCSGFFIKPEVTFVHSSREYECFAGNDGWTIYTEDKTFRENSSALMLAFGFQASYEHFFIELSLGCGSYSSSNIFHRSWKYGFWGWGDGRGFCTYNTIKLGIPF